MPSGPGASPPLPLHPAPPLVTVILPIYNGCTPSPSSLHASLQSLLDQSLPSLHLLLVDDASTDSTPSLLSHFASLHPHVTLRTHPTRLGVAAALNTALTPLPSTPFIARMDADDVSAPSRLQAQVEYLHSHPHVDVVGTAVEVRSGEGGRVIELPTSPLLTEWGMAFYCTLAHPSVMWRAGVVGGYSTSPLHRHVEDLELWFRLIRSHHALTSLPSPPLLTLHKHGGSVSSLHAAQQRHSALHLTRSHLEWLTRHRIRCRDVGHLVDPRGMGEGGEAVDAVALLLLMERAFGGRKGRKPGEGDGEGLRGVEEDVTKRMGEMVVMGMRLQGGRGEVKGEGSGDECGVEGCVWQGEEREAVSAGWPAVPELDVDVSGLMGLWLKRNGGAQSRALLLKLMTA